ncbi:type IV pilus modification PilV family protein [Glaciecola petra]|uniref:Prepilin-type N-terminal cleavage/methylation domain-containing protein n=1 Tax=Glaciecola petra TaxID=3075602 RepID=A0ABU2ZSN2_9ALTE|nr:prepilin-type N-terminal cleavage/methylation domain-containing protein [Aestuariibacter sp. P117]MDT0595647.1 prepilin-type N-terminal cleavage/methylation domain-containing protein [Aestuariibacter sp. P117]
MLVHNTDTKQFRSGSQHGFTLIEIVVGIVLFSIAMVFISSIILPQAKRGVDPIWQVRSVTLAQSILNEITSKAFDENTIVNGTQSACNFLVDCSTSSQLGPDSGEVRNLFDDIDDYNGLELTGADIANSAGLSYSSDVSDLFLGFQASVSVFYDANTDGINDDDLDQDGNLDSGTLIAEQKRIVVNVTTPGGEVIVFSTYRYNF